MAALTQDLSTVPTDFNKHRDKPSRTPVTSTPQPETTNSASSPKSTQSRSPNQTTTSKPLSTPPSTSPSLLGSINPPDRSNLHDLSEQGYQTLLSWSNHDDSSHNTAGDFGIGSTLPKRTPYTIFGV
ncbi:hypothetical protein Tdes44962_MAKER06325 [Teratosphaeria destructans]|uniref:Uncharacterized protein n=1 Tax=Teratosphaeria destructans TaxID=418781 RepID=A0A9W7SHN6_9PEZI|nr:hypothetical protein Tdes44962_MAKER06325 [Teratosphaeria destructans]